MNDSLEFAQLLSLSSELGLTAEQIKDLVDFRERVVAENAVQNLTRLRSPNEFFEGHVLDVFALKKSRFVEFPPIDLGAGMGVPGVLSAVLDRRGGKERWISCDSEAKKADFTARLVEAMGLNSIHVHAGRAEDFLRENAVHSVVARAVGPVGRLYGWLKGCSTWNNLVLLKGPRWDEEWKEFQSSSQRNRLKISAKHEYEVGFEKKYRVIVRLERC